ncbi:MAG: VWA domain-containing protein [Desulfobacterales bacterium]|nr:VWA domain-containing protein [Desulfobacterales bacterium]MBS3756027.1 VWA domain-containing protein [Desulfobacterales bacterium]
MHPLLETARTVIGRPFVPRRERPVRGRHPSRFRKPVLAKQGRKIAVRPWEQTGRIDIPASIFEAWKRGHLQPGARDLVSSRSVAPLSRLVVFLLDVSESMSDTLEWMRVWVRTAMEQAYLRRDSVAVVVVQGKAAGVLVHPTTSLGFVLHRLSEVRVGGGTPLDRGIMAIHRIMLQHRDAYPVIDMCLLTDARSTSPLDTPEVRARAREVSRGAREVVLLNPGSGTDRHMQELAAVLNASLIDMRR